MMWWPDWGWLRRVAIAELAVVFVVSVVCILAIYSLIHGNRQVDYTDTLIRVNIHRHIQYYIDERHQICFAAGDEGFLQIDDSSCDRLLATYGEP